MATPLIGVFMILLVIGIVVGVLWVIKKRQQDMAVIAQELKLTFYPKGDNSLSPLLSQLEFFSYGQHRRVRNLMKGTMQKSGHKFAVAIFDYYYTVGHGKQVDTLGQTVLLFYDESLQLPGFSLRPEHLFDKFANILGFVDINFREFPTFSKHYRLQGKPEKLVRELFQPNLLKFYERQKICTEAQGASVCVFPSDEGFKSNSIKMQSSKTFTVSRLIHPNEVKTFLDTGLRLIELLRYNKN